MRRSTTCWIIIAAFCSLGAQHQTTNFLIHAPNAQIAQQVGQYAEHYRREKALQWLGYEMPPWRQPCPLHVSVTMDGPSGATSFHFGPATILSMKMEIQGPLDRLLASVLPHEITHTVFAHHFRQPVPRWADEGGSVLSEDDIECARHDKLTRQILNRGQQIPLRRLFNLKEYPREVMCLYAQGYSMCDYLVKRSDRRTFLSFVGHGMHHGWDSAVQSFYGLRNVEALEAAWLQHLRDTRQQPHQDTLAAQNQGRNVNPTASRPTALQPAATASRPISRPTGSPIVRLTVPPVQPLDPAPIIRGAAPTPLQVGQRFGQIPPPPPFPTASRPPATNWQPVTVRPIPAAAPRPVVQLLAPQFEAQPPTAPVGFPR
ncbi:MAG: hypothetical protein L0Y71_02345 [Gemmataceae bacterium]|nr:hypothetical protein [Gemmataceae bacterium]